MTKYKVEFSPESERELEDYYLYIAEDSPANAVKWYFETRDQIDTLYQDPARCPYADENDFHRFEVRNLIIGNYRVLFRIKDQTVQILHVKHGKMERVPLEKSS